MFPQVPGPFWGNIVYDVYGLLVWYFSMVFKTHGPCFKDLKRIFEIVDQSALIHVV